MVKNEVKLNWDGEKIKQEVVVPDYKITPKELLDSLDHARNQVGQMKQQKAQIENNLAVIEKDIRSAESFIKERGDFEDKCEVIQLDKLKLYISQIETECKAKALDQTKTIISQDPEAYTDDQKVNMNYVNFQRLIATDKKIAENISKRLIQKHLFETPVFNNPFKD